MKSLFAILLILLATSCSRWTSEEMNEAMADCTKHTGEFISADIKMETPNSDSQVVVSDSLKDAYRENMTKPYCECILGKLSRQMTYEEYKSGLYMMDGSYLRAAEECGEEE